MDNAAVHTGEDTVLQVIDTLENCGIDLRLLPTYSPELSPIELVFGIVKAHIKYKRTMQTLQDAILYAFGTLNHEILLGCYHHVIDLYLKTPINVPPELD